eukprot:gene8320-10263_t
MTMMTDVWVNETLYPDWGQRFLVKRELARVKSDFQDIMLFESTSHGRVMVLDGVIQITGVASPLRLSATPPVLRNAPPALGQHTDEVLRELLGYDANQLKQLNDSGVTSSTPTIGELMERMAIPAIAAPMFLVSGVDMVLAACKAGIIGAFPGNNARPLQALNGRLVVAPAN